MSVFWMKNIEKKKTQGADLSLLYGVKYTFNILVKWIVQLLVIKANSTFSKVGKIFIFADTEETHTSEKIGKYFSYSIY